MQNAKQKLQSEEDIFNRIKTSLQNSDPVLFCEQNLTLDGAPFRLRGNGFKPFVDIYRYIGIKLLNPKNKPVVLVKGRQVGATTMAANLAMYWMGSGIFGRNDRSPIRIMHCFPWLDLAGAYSKTKLEPTISKSRLVQGKNGRTIGIMESLLNPNKNNSEKYKEFPDGNHIWVDSIGVDGDRLRGRTVDVMFFDEVQDMMKKAILNGQKIAAQAKYGPVNEGVRVFMGTPKSAGSYYHEMWKASTQNYYYLGCEACNSFFPLYTPGSDEWETEIWIEEFTVQCPHCGKRQDKREAAERGKWVGKPEEDCEYIGFHINQLYMPTFPKEAILKHKPGNNPLADEEAWNNEVLGEFYSSSTSTLTADEIVTKCGDIDRKVVSRILPEQCTNDRHVYLGADWGKRVDTGRKSEDKKSGGQSYSVIVILKTEGPELFSVQFALKLPDNSPEYKIGIIEQTMINYNVRLAVGDIGYAEDLTKMLQAQFGHRFLASRANDNLKGKAKFDKEDIPACINFDRNYFIQELYNLLRRGAIRFPVGTWDGPYGMGWLIQHCASMIEKPRVTRFGEIKREFAKGPTPNDGFMALLNAYLAYKYSITAGFTQKNNLFATPEQINDRGVSVASVYAPGFRAIR